MRNFKKKIIIIWLLFFLLIFSMGATKHVLEGGNLLKGNFKETVLFLSSFIQNTKKIILEESPQMFNNEHSEKNGFTYFKNKSDLKGYILISTWDFTSKQPIIKLIRVNDGKIIYKWLPNVKSEIDEYNSFKSYNLEHDLKHEKIALQHPFLNNDGSIVFSMGGTFKINLNGDFLWKNYSDCHHSIEIDSDSNYWICGYNSNRTNAEKYQIRDDALIKLNKSTGKIEFEKSVLEIFLQNGFSISDLFISPLITTENKYLDYFHLNDVQPVLVDGEYWKKGDLFFSLRNQNFIGLFRPSTNKLIWFKRGPWLKQHDIDIISPNEIALFGNNVIDARFSNKKRFVDNHNEVYIYNFSNNTLIKPFSLPLSQKGVMTHTEGLMRVINHDTVFIDESNKGRLHFFSNQKVIWTYAEVVNTNYLAKINWSRYITEEEFKNLQFLKKK